MPENKILKIALPKPLHRLFDYLPPQSIDLNTLKKGARVKVPFQSRKIVGILTEISSHSAVSYEKLKYADSILDTESIFPDDIYELCVWASQYYHAPLGEVFSSALPALLRKGKEAFLKTEDNLNSSREKTSALILNEAQTAAVNTILAHKNNFKSFLLYGITGSGKTEVYLQAIENILQDNKQVLVLLPEINLTPQTVARFRERFSVEIVSLHSSLTDTERLTAWLKARAGIAKIVIGTRSAIFTPFKQLGLIIVDEEHDASFKQQDRFRYHARDLAIMRAHLNHIPIVLGSATPSLESFYNAERGRYHLLSLPARAGDAILPDHYFIPVTKNIEHGLTPELIAAMREQLENHNQVMLFLNRRGFAPVFYCLDCAHIFSCTRCDARLVYHRAKSILQCHCCDKKIAIPKNCPTCQGQQLEPVGIGTQRLEETLQKYFPDIPIIRLDRDTTQRKHALENLLTQIHTEKKAILLGTQMLAKGHHFPNVTLVGIVDADQGLFSADFRAAEQMAQLLVQVSGRAGRAEKKGTVMIQTRHPNHSLFQILFQQDYFALAKVLLNERLQSELPPFNYTVLLRAESFSEEQAKTFLEMIKNRAGHFTHAVNLLGPSAAYIAKRKGMYSQQLLIKSAKRSHLQYFLKTLLAQLEALPIPQNIKWMIDVDPAEI